MIKRIAITAAVTAMSIGMPTTAQAAHRCASNDSIVKVAGKATCADAKAVKRALFSARSHSFNANGHRWTYYMDNVNHEHIVCIAASRIVHITWYLD